MEVNLRGKTSDVVGYENSRGLCARQAWSRSGHFKEVTFLPDLGHRGLTREVCQDVFCFYRHPGCIQQAFVHFAIRRGRAVNFEVGFFLAVFTRQEMPVPPDPRYPTTVKLDGRLQLVVVASTGRRVPIHNLRH